MGAQGQVLRPRPLPMDPGLRPWTLHSASAPLQLSERGDNQSHMPEPQFHLLQIGKCCPAYISDGFKNLVKEKIIVSVFCERLQVCVLPISELSWDHAASD